MAKKNRQQVFIIYLEQLTKIIFILPKTRFERKTRADYNFT